MRIAKLKPVLVGVSIAALLGCGGGQAKKDCPPCDCQEGAAATVAAAAAAPAEPAGKPAEGGEAGQIPERSTIEAKYKWTPEEIYTDEAAWNADVKKMEGLLEKAATFKGFLPEFAGQRLLLMARPDENDFAHPFHWAAFGYTGA